MSANRHFEAVTASRGCGWAARADKGTLRLMGTDDGMTMRSATPPRANPAAVSGDRDNRAGPRSVAGSGSWESGRAHPRPGRCAAGHRSILVIPRVGNNLAPALARLDDLADGADFVLGHNVIGFDLPYLRAADPGLRLLDLPAVDTLPAQSAVVSRQEV